MYPDPNVPGGRRYWDGNEWSSDFTPPPPQVGVPERPTAAQRPSEGPWWERVPKVWLLVGVVAVTVLVVVGALMGGEDVDWFDRADNAETCLEAAQVVMDYAASDDDNGLRGSGTHGYLSARRDALCG